MTEAPAEATRREYDMRRAAHGAEAPIEISRWKRRLVTGGIVFGVLVAACVASWVWWAYTYVITSKASVYCELVQLSAEVDARLQKLYVKPGDHIDKGQPVARLDDSELIAALDGAKAELTIRQSDLAQQQASLRLIRGQVDAQIALAKAQVAIADAALVRTEAQREHFKARMPELIRQAKALRNEAQARHDDLKKGTRPERIEAARARLATADERRKFYKLEVDIAERLSKQGVVSGMEMEQKRTALAVAENELTEGKLQLALALAGATEDELAASQSALEAREAALALAETADRELKRLDAELAVRRAELEEAKAREKQAFARQLEVELAAERAKAAEAQVTKANAAVAQRQAALSVKTIVSPVSGTVLRTFDEEGEVCRKGIPIVFVKDDSKGYWIEGFVEEEDAQYLKPKQAGKVEIVIGSWHFVDAEVALVSLSTSSIERSSASSAAAGNSRSPSQTEKVWVKLRLKGEPEHLVLPGMSARAYIRVR